MIYFTAHTFKCVCHCRRAMFRVLGMYNFASRLKVYLLPALKHHTVKKSQMENRITYQICTLFQKYRFGTESIF